MAWRIEGEYFENCSCDVLCPCITSPISGPADTERCQVPFAIQIHSGHFDDISLDGLAFVQVFDAPAIMSQGNWRVATYIDERADAPQRQALEQILSGQHGGVPAALGALMGQRLGTKFVPITYQSQGPVKHVAVPGIMEFTVEGIVTGNKVLEITNTTHPMGADLPIAKSRRGYYNDPDYGLSFDNTGKNGHYVDFVWQGQ